MMEHHAATRAAALAHWQRLQTAAIRLGFTLPDQERTRIEQEYASQPPMQRWLASQDGHHPATESRDGTPNGTGDRSGRQQT